MVSGRCALGRYCHFPDHSCLSELDPLGHEDRVLSEVLSNLIISVTLMRYFSIHFTTGHLIPHDSGRNASNRGAIGSDLDESAVLPSVRDRQ
jgi:hypothetical protein